MQTVDKDSVNWAKFKRGKRSFHVCYWQCYGKRVLTEWSAKENVLFSFRTPSASCLAGVGNKYKEV